MNHNDEKNHYVTLRSELKKMYPERADTAMSLAETNEAMRVEQQFLASLRGRGEYDKYCDYNDLARDNIPVISPNEQ
nr:hypothetical protein [uncultured bacterium]AMP54303.1 hypothetical protein [uncultured bacterium]AMP54396.1 hypothetical protein [uncultured bacterium]AMP54423.1 hypothetical protein [uncultured bacterium]